MHSIDFRSIIKLQWERDCLYISPPRIGEIMPASKAQQKAVSKYMKENYDVYQIRMPKGKKDSIKAHAEARGESVNGFINRAIDETMDRDKAAPVGSEGEG